MGLYDQLKKNSKINSGVVYEKDSNKNNNIVRVKVNVNPNNSLKTENQPSKIRDTIGDSILSQRAEIKNTQHLKERCKKRRFEAGMGWKPGKSLQGLIYCMYKNNQGTIPAIKLATIGDNWIEDAKLDVLRQVKEAGWIEYKTRNEITDYARRKIPEKNKIKIRKQTYYIFKN
jgi:hypothetical protein